MNYVDKCMITTIASQVAMKKDLNILCQYGKLNGKNTASITIDGNERLFTDYNKAKVYLNSL